MGTRLGRYEVDAVLGHGGMAEILLAHPTGPGPGSAQVVLKRLLPELRGRLDFVQMFLDEARVCARLSHPHIVGVLELGQADGLPFLVLEYLNGPTLSQVITRQRELGEFNPTRAARVVAAVARGLDHAHRAVDEAGHPLHLVHRDVTPQNVIITTGGQVKLFDFGVARAESNSVKTKVGVLKGKTSFLSPEQVMGAQVDHRADLFACGVLLYVLSTGRLPFAGETDLTVLKKIVGGEYPAPSTVVGGYPQPLEAVLAKALATDPAQRFQSGAELAQALGEYSVGTPAGDQADLARWVGQLFGNWNALQQQRLAGGRAGPTGAAPAPTPSRRAPTPVGGGPRASFRPPSRWVAVALAVALAALIPTAVALWTLTRSPLASVSPDAGAPPRVGERPN
jgi:serine/threonine protein kinase